MRGAMRWCACWMVSQAGASVSNTVLVDTRLFPLKRNAASAYSTNVLCGEKWGDVRQRGLPEILAGECQAKHRRVLLPSRVRYFTYINLDRGELSAKLSFTLPQKRVAAPLRCVKEQ